MSLPELRVETRGEVVRAALAGDIDLSNADELRQEIAGVTPNEALALILDLSQVRYLDSAGVRLIHRLREDLRAHGQRLQLVIPPPSMIHDTLRLAGLDWSPEISGSLAAAQDALRADTPL